MNLIHHQRVIETARLSVKKLRQGSVWYRFLFLIHLQIRRGGPTVLIETNCQHFLELIFRCCLVHKL